MFEQNTHDVPVFLCAFFQQSFTENSTTIISLNIKKAHLFWNCFYLLYSYSTVFLTVPIALCQDLAP